MTGPRKILVTWEIVGWVLLLLVVLPSLFVYGWREWNMDDRAPVTAFHSVEVMNSPIIAGQTLTVRVWREKVRDDCPVTAIRTAIDQDGRTWDIENAYQIEGGSPDSASVDLGYPIPLFFPPGQYELRVRLIYHCPGDLTFTYDQPNARFRVIAR